MSPTDARARPSVPRCARRPATPGSAGCRSTMTRPSPWRQARGACGSIQRPAIYPIQGSGSVCGAPGREVTPLHTLALFDIDGTLIHTLGAGIRGMNAAFARLYGIEAALDGVPISGRTDRAIVTDAFRKIG